MEKETFKIRVDCLSQLYDIGKKISIIELGMTASSIRTYQLEKIVEKILLHCNSIFVLINKAAENKYKELDISIIASAARNIMESTNYYFYIAERKIGSNEIKFRYDLASLNCSKCITDIMRKLQYFPSAFRAQIIPFGDGILKKEIRSSSTFQQADSSVQAHLLSGHKQGYKIGRAKILEGDKESAIYNILSNSVHGLYMGLGNNSVYHSLIYNNYFGATMLLMLACEITIIYTANVLGDYLNLRKRLYKYLNMDEKQSLKEMKSIDVLHKYLEYEKEEFGHSFFDQRV